MMTNDDTYGRTDAGCEGAGEADVAFFTLNFQDGRGDSQHSILPTRTLVHDEDEGSPSPAMERPW